MNDVSSLRQAIMASLPAETSLSGQAPDIGNLYIPSAHVKALRLDCHLVIGARGVGKSVWTAALGDPHLRQALGAAVRELEHTEVRIGFSEKSDIDAFPDVATFSHLLQKHDSHDIWKAVVVRWLAGSLQQPVPTATWDETVDWVVCRPEDTARLMQAASRYFSGRQKNGLIVFDALDRLSQDWNAMDRIVRGLLQTALWLKPFPGLSAKIFLREDQFDRAVTNFPDASKLLATRAELTWAAHDLHGLLWYTFSNASSPHGERLRDLYDGSERWSIKNLDLSHVLDAIKRGVEKQQEFDFYEGPVEEEPIENSRIWWKESGIWRLPDRIKRDERTQRVLFEKLAGPWMGRDKRRGVPYVWAVSHLADGQGRTSPRSFLAAIRQAAEDSFDHYPNHPLALHYESIKRGIQKASEIRVNEISEDYPWVKTLMQPLSGLNVPADYAQFQDRWTRSYPKGPSSVAAATDALPPQHVANGWDGIRDDLIRIGIFTKHSKNERLDMPDLYRVGFGLGRRGGVKPHPQAG